MKIRTWMPIGLGCCLLMPACSDDDSTPGPSAPADATVADAAVDAPTGDASTDALPEDAPDDVEAEDSAATPEASAPITVIGIKTNSSNNPIEGLEVCILKNAEKSTDCTMTNAKGEFIIDVPSHEEVGLTFYKAGYQPSLWPLYLTAPVPEQLVSFQWSDAEASPEYAKIGATYPFDGVGSILVKGPAISFATAPPAGVGPYYGSFEFDESLTQSPNTPAGWGELLELPPGVYDVDVTHETQICTTTRGWPPKPGHSLRVPVLAGYVTASWSSCN